MTLESRDDFDKFGSHVPRCINANTVTCIVPGIGMRWRTVIFFFSTDYALGSLT